MYRKGLAFKGMMCSSDGDAWRKILVMGSVWLLPSIRLATIGCSVLLSIESAIHA